MMDHAKIRYKHNANIAKYELINDISFELKMRAHKMSDEDIRKYLKIMTKTINSKRFVI